MGRLEESVCEVYCRLTGIEVYQMMAETPAHTGKALCDFLLDKTETQGSGGSVVKKSIPSL